MRKFAITKALLLKADRSSFERYKRQVGAIATCLKGNFNLWVIPFIECYFFLTFQISKLDFEKQRLVEDGAVYNHLTEQFKLSQAYKKVYIPLSYFLLSSIFISQAIYIMSVTFCGLWSLNVLRLVIPTLTKLGK